MFSKQFSIIENDKSHIQFKHLKIEEPDFNKLIVKSIFDDKELYKYVTNDLNRPTDELQKKYPIGQLINLIKNIKNEYIKNNFPTEIKKKICKKLKPKLNGSIIDVRATDWEEKYDEYLSNKFNGYDVVAEIILSKIIEEKFNASVFLTKLALTTNKNMKVFGMDTVHYNDQTNTIYYGESKLTNNIDLGLEQHELELDMTDYKVTQECQLLGQYEQLLRNDISTNRKISEFGRKLSIDKVLSLFKYQKEKWAYNIAIVYFVAHGDDYNYDAITMKIKKFMKKVKYKNVEVNFVTLPIKNKLDFTKKIEEVVLEYERK